MKKLYKTLKKVRRLAIIAGFLCAAIFTGNQAANQHEHRYGRSRNIRHPSGFFGYTQVEGEYRYEKTFFPQKIIKSHLLDTKIMRDENGDGIVDKLSTSRPWHSQTLERERDYDTHKDEFDEADRDFAETMKEFADELAEEFKPIPRPVSVPTHLQLEKLGIGENN